MTKSVFIDGSQGTTGLTVATRLSGRNDLSLIILTGEERKDPKIREEALNDADISILCLPDDAAREAVSFVKNPKARIIDASTAHRTNANFAYGFPELSGEHRRRIEELNFCSVPGCHATGFIALAYPLVSEGLLPSDTKFTCFSLTGYSGGGKNMIAEYEDEDRSGVFSSPRIYALSQQHKHLREMQKIPNLAEAPIFCPIVDDYYAGMIVTVPLFMSQLPDGMTPARLRLFFENMYGESPLITVLPFGAEAGFYDAGSMAGKDAMEILVSGNNERVTLMTRFDNLGKGACGAAIQCLNIISGSEELKGLTTA